MTNETTPTAPAGPVGNEAAERLRFWWANLRQDDPEAADDYDLALREALAAERRATVEPERLADAMWEAWSDRGEIHVNADGPLSKELIDLATSLSRAILDEEAGLRVPAEGEGGTRG